MTKRFRFRISRLISCFQSCRTRHPSNSKSTLPSNPKPHHSSLRRHVSSALTSVSCGLRSRPSPSDDHHDYLWRKEDKWHVVAKAHDDDTTPRRKIYNSSASGGSGLDDDVLPLPPAKRRLKKRKTTPPRGRISTSSADRTCGLFSSDGYDEEEETEALVSSSRSTSTDSTARETPRGEEKKRKKKARGSGGSTVAAGRKKSVSSPEMASPARVSMFERVIPWRESTAVVKKSENPYEDFRRSMLEMIVEKSMFEEKELEQLLCCFLSLNSAKHHGLIVQAFTDIWEALFCFCNAD